MAEQSQSEENNLHKRVYFLCGLDPRGSAYYYRIFREEARKSSKLSGIKYTVSKPKPFNPLVHHWQVTAVKESIVNVDYRFLVWDDLIRQRWIHQPLKLIWAALPFHVEYFKHGIFAKFRKAGISPYLHYMYPSWLVCLSLISAIIFALAVFNISKLFIANISLNLLLSMIAGLFLLKKALAFGERIGTWFILQSYLFIAQWAKAPLPELEEKLDAFAQQMLDDFNENPQQDIVLVAHCIGAILAIPLLERLIKRAPPEFHDKFQLITLGQCIPYISYVPSATHYRESMRKVNSFNQTQWIDIGARIDPFCFDEINPSIAKDVPQKHPNLLQSIIRPSQMYAQKVFAKLKKQKLKMHFQYLMASEIAVHYDYFAMLTQLDYNLNGLEKATLKEHVVV
jgi:hypothetical protein